MRFLPLPPGEDVEEHDCFAWSAFAGAVAASMTRLLTADQQGDCFEPWLLSAALSIGVFAVCFSGEAGGKAAEAK